MISNNTHTHTQKSHKKLNSIDGNINVKLHVTSGKVIHGRTFEGLKCLSLMCGDDGLQPAHIFDYLPLRFSNQRHDDPVVANYVRAGRSGQSLVPRKGSGCGEGGSNRPPELFSERVPNQAYPNPNSTDGDGYTKYNPQHLYYIKAKVETLTSTIANLIPKRWILHQRTIGQTPTAKCEQKCVCVCVYSFRQATAPKHRAPAATWAPAPAPSTGTSTSTAQHQHKHQQKH